MKPSMCSPGSRTATLLSALMLACSVAHPAEPCSAAAGAVVFADKCSTCHSNERNAAPIVGPALFGVLNRRPASLEGFAYSAAMRARSESWTPAALDWFLADPLGRLPGTYMAFSGVKNEAARAALICYLGTLGSNPKN